MLTLADLGVLREVSEAGGTVTVSITPTYTGCPAMDAMRDDLVHALHLAGFPDVEVRTVLQPAWSTDWISAAGRRKLTRAGIAPPARRSQAGDRADPADPRAAARSGALPAVRLRPDQARFVFQRDRLPVTAPLRGLPGAVRARQGDLSGDNNDRAAAAGTVPHADRGRGEPAVRGRRGGDLRRPGRAGRRLRVPGRPVADAAPVPRRAGGAPLVLDLRAGRGPAADRRARGAGRAVLPLAGPAGPAGRRDLGRHARRQLHARDRRPRATTC